MAVRKHAAGASLALLAGAALGARPSPAFAQEADVHALAVQLFEEAGQAQDRRAYDEACPKFAKVVELEPAKVGAKLALAECYEQAGKLASAVTAYRAAGVRAALAGDPRSKLAAERVAKLEAKAPRVTIHVPEALASLPGLTILRDGTPVEASQWNRAMLSDPGEHTLYVGAPGKKPWSGKVTVTAGEIAEIVIGGLEDLSPPVPAPLGREPPTGGPIASGTLSRSVPSWAWVTGGLGLASSGVAVAFAADQAAAQGDFDARCKSATRDAPTCDALKGRLYRDFGLWIGLGAAGAAALAVATIGIVTAPRHHAPAPRKEAARASFWIAPQRSGVVLYGRF